MRRLLLLLLLAASLVAEAGPVHAQATADQLNKLSLEALTAPPPAGSGGGYSRRPSRSYGYGARRARPSYARRSYAHRSYARRSYARPSYRAPSYRSVRRYSPIRHYGNARRSVARAPARHYGGYHPVRPSHRRPRRY